MIEVECDNCGTTVEKYPRTLERSDHVFCDSECHNEFQTEYERRDCDRCGTEIDRKPSTYEDQELVFCSVECESKYHRDRWPSVECANCETEFTLPPALHRQRIERQGNERFFCSNECQGEWETGENNPNYGNRPGDPVYGHSWREQRRAARERDGYECAACGMSEDEHLDEYGWQLEVHHTIPFRKFDDSEEANALENLVTLCREHHRKYEHIPAERARELIE